MEKRIVSGKFYRNEVCIMKKWKKVILIILLCYVSFYSSYGVLKCISIDMEIALDISAIFFLLPIIIYFLIIKPIINKENKEITKISPKIQDLIKVNESYDFKSINQNKHNIVEREFSRKSLYRVTGASVIKYHIENNINSFRTDIENAIYNINLLDKYNEEVKLIEQYEFVNNSKYSDKKYKRIENRVFNNLKYEKEDFKLSLKLEVYHRSNGGNVNENRKGKYNFDQLIEFYNEWQNGNKYEETKKQERKIMNDDIRYNVLKRDNFTCQICGVTAKDGAKLHVEHIVPIAKGGKTVMSNLQTLCERCNMGKGDKTSEDEDSMICPRCGSKLVKRNGKYGNFIGCSNYPKCRYKK